MTWAPNGPVPGEFMALRWGMGEDCVVVIKLDDSHKIRNYYQLVERS